MDDVVNDGFSLDNIEFDRLVSVEESVEDVLDGNDEDGKGVSGVEVGAPFSCLLGLAILSPLLKGSSAVDGQFRGLLRPRLDASATDAVQFIRCIAHECKLM